MSYVIEEYSTLSIAVFGDLDKYEQALIHIGGCKNHALKGPNNTKRTGIIFSKKREAEVRSIMEKLKNGVPCSVVLSATSSSSSSSAASATNRTFNTSSNNASTAVSEERFNAVHKLVKALSSRVEAVETELAALRKSVAAGVKSVQAVPRGTAKRTQVDDEDTEIVADDADDVMEDNEEEEDAASVVGNRVIKSLIVRRK